MHHIADETGPSDRPVPQPFDVSVVVLCKDEPSLEISLTEIRTQITELGESGISAECVVVDASEHRLDWIRQAHPWVRWVDYRVPFAKSSSIPEQRNVGVHTATGRVVAFCDSGGRPLPGWLRNLTAPLLEGELTVTCGPISSVRPGVYRTMNDLPDRAPVNHIVTANVAFTRDAFLAIDGFDERYAYGSDADFAWRLASAGHVATNVSDARMGMDWGEWSTQLRRSWRYGRAMARLWRFHPRRRVRILRDNPQMVVYPAVVLAALAALAALVLYRRWRPSTLVAAFVGLLRWRNRRTPKPWSVLLNHVIYAAGSAWELLSAKLRPRPSVLHTPRDPGPYQGLLLEALAAEGVRSDYLTGPTGSKTLNLLLAPLRAPWLRLCGVRVLHLHWVHEYNLTWSAGRRLAGRFTRMMLRLTLDAVRASGIKVVWTAHNVVPHERTFDDDLKGRRDLVRRCDAVIAHNEETAAELRRRFGAGDVAVIPQGAYPLPVRPRADARAELGLPADRFVLAMVGRIAPYKGFTDLLDALCGLPSERRERLTVLIAGEPVDEDFAAEIDAACERARVAGFDVQVLLRHLKEEELALRVAAADLLAYPFRSITNSGSVLLALSNARPALVPDLDTLADLPDAAVLRYRAADSVSLAGALGAAMDADLDLMGEEAAVWARGRDWSETARLTRQVYEQVLLGGKGRS